jgi:hypothetical protein
MGLKFLNNRDGRRLLSAAQLCHESAEERFQEVRKSSSQALLAKELGEQRWSLQTNSVLCKYIF